MCEKEGRKESEHMYEETKVSVRVKDWHVKGVSRRRGWWKEDCRVRGRKCVGRHKYTENHHFIVTNIYTTFTEAPGAHRTGGGGGVWLQGRPRQVLGVRVREQGVLPRLPTHLLLGLLLRHVGRR